MALSSRALKVRAWMLAGVAAANVVALLVAGGTAWWFDVFVIAAALICAWLAIVMNRASTGEGGSATG